MIVETEKSEGSPDGPTRFKTENGGNSWFLQESGTSEWLTGICVTAEGTGLAVGVNGIILKTVTGGSRPSSPPSITRLPDFRMEIVEKTVSIDLDSCVVDKEGPREAMHWRVRLLDSGVVSVFLAGRSASIMALRDGTPRVLFEVIDPKGYRDLRELTIEVFDSTPVASMGIPNRFSMDPNHPNPFNLQTVIGFEIPTAGKPEIAIFNLRGERVALRLRSWIQLGRHRIVFEGNDLPSGLYLCRLRFKGQSLIQKLIPQK